MHLTGAVLVWFSFLSLGTERRPLYAAQGPVHTAPKPKLQSLHLGGPEFSASHWGGAKVEAWEVSKAASSSMLGAPS